MNNQSIIINAPNGWTHYVLDNGTNYYFKIEGLNTCIWTSRWESYTNNRLSLPDLDGVRNRLDIERIVELENKLKSRNTELESIADILTDEMKSKKAKNCTGWVAEGIKDNE